MIGNRGQERLRKEDRGQETRQWTGDKGEEQGIIDGSRRLGTRVRGLGIGDRGQEMDYRLQDTRDW